MINIQCISILLINTLLCRQYISLYNHRYKYKQKENLLQSRNPYQSNMLPALKKPTQQYHTSQIKLYNPPKQLVSIDNHENQRKSSHYSNMMASSRTNNKMKAMSSGFKKGQAIQKDGGIVLGKKQSKTNNYNYQNYPPNTSVKQNSLTKDQSYGYEYGNMPNKSTANVMSAGKRDLNAEIKLIQKKIRYHKKKIQEQKKRKQEEQKRKDDPFNQEFQRIIQKEMQLQGIPLQENKGFDYLTNPGGKPNQQEPQQQQIEQPIEEPEPIIVAQPKKFDLIESVQKLERHYENNLKKKFQRRQMFPHYPCKRKTPKLYITQKTNALQKFGKKPPKQQHMFRIMTRQCTPQQIYPTIPNFAVVKDSLSRNVMAYLGDYKPFIEKTKQVAQDQQQLNEPNQQVQSLEKIETSQHVRIEQNLSMSQNKQQSNISLNA